MPLIGTRVVVSTAMALLHAHALAFEQAPVWLEGPGIYNYGAIDMELSGTETVFTISKDGAGLTRGDRLVGSVKVLSGSVEGCIHTIFSRSESRRHALNGTCLLRIAPGPTAIIQYKDNGAIRIPQSQPFQIVISGMTE